MVAGIQLVNTVQIAWLIPGYLILGVLDRWASLVWLVSAVSSSVIHPILSYYSNRATCKLRRHRPFSFAGAVAVTIAFLTIGFATDIGYAFGDNFSEKNRPRALAIFGIRLWILEISINIINALYKDFLDDLASRDQRTIRLIYTYVTFFMAVENELGYFAIFFRRFDDMLSFTVTEACHELRANVKTLSIFSILLLLFLMAVALSCVQDKPALPEEESHKREEEDDRWAVDEEHGKFYSVTMPLYTIGFSYGARCLMITWAVTGLMSLAVEPIVRTLGGVKNLWASENFILADGLAITLYISKLVKDERLERNDLTFTREPSNGIQT
ncbi:Sucrose transport protein [Arachis hypogaea]|nr:Sucrose transport protein [Arachis hypogaea]